MVEDSRRLDLDNLIYRLWKVKNCKVGTQVNLHEHEISALCCKAQGIFLQQPMLLRLPVPINVCGDLHGQFYDLLRWFESYGVPPCTKYLFLGDYIDRGKQSIETICLLLSYKVKYPQHIFLLRGNHECETISAAYGFLHECEYRYSFKLWKTFIDCFNCLPVAAIIDHSIFCCHGGLSPDLRSLKQIEKIPRPVKIPTEGLLCDLLWSDPGDANGWEPNVDRQISFSFGENVVKDFVRRHKLDLVCRAHQVVPRGYEFFADRKLVTVFSAPNYSDTYNNTAALMAVDPTLLCSFKTLAPL